MIAKFSLIIEPLSIAYEKVNSFNVAIGTQTFKLYIFLGTNLCFWR